jgi:hypothetical protein
MIKIILHLSHDYRNNPTRNNNLQNQINSNGVDNDKIYQCVNTINWLHNVNSKAWRLQGKGQKDMGLLSWNLKFHIFCNSHESILHNIMQGHLLLTMSVVKKVNPHKVQRLATNVMWRPKD